MADLIVLNFGTTHGAAQAMSAVRALQEMNYAWMEDVAVVERHNSGRVSTHTTHGSTTAAAAWGGLTGMFVGLLFPPLSILGMWAAGAGGAAAGAKIAKEKGLDSDMLDEVKDSIGKGTSALILIGAEGDADQMAQAFESHHPTNVIRKAMPEKAVADLKADLEATPAE